MTPVLRLTIIYFFGTRLYRGLTITAGALTSLGIVGLWKYSSRYSPVISPGRTSHMSGASIAFSALLWMIPIIGVLTLFFSAALLPLVFGHLARGRQLHLLPHGRVRLLASVLLTLSLVAAIFALVVEALYLSFPVPPGAVFGKSFAIGLLTFAPMYLLLWIVSRAKGAIGSLSGAMLIIPSLALPFHFILVSKPPVFLPIAAGLSIGLACLAAFLWVPRWMQPRASGRSTRGTYPRGREFAVLAGVPPPWVLGGGLAAPIAVATLFIASPDIWLCYFMLCSVISGGISSQSVPRSRALWLRGPWSRVNMFSRLEALFWSQNAYCLAVLIILLLAVGSYLKFPTALLAVAIPLLVVGSAAGTYLGLMMTRGIGWLDGLSAGTSMLLMLGIALYALSLPHSVLAATYLSLAGLALAFRFVARKRWAHLDWMSCRQHQSMSQ
jgi:hypothetical protein